MAIKYSLIDQKKLIDLGAFNDALFSSLFAALIESRAAC